MVDTSLYNVYFFSKYAIQHTNNFDKNVVVVHDWNNYRGLTDKYTVKLVYKDHGNLKLMWPL